MASKKPTVKKGSHLTVTTSPDGSVNLVWDWEALSQDVAEALALYQLSKKEKSAKKKKQ